MPPPFFTFQTNKPLFAGDLSFPALPPNLRQGHKPLNRLDHLVETRPFQRRMGIVAAAGEIGRGQAKLRQPRAVGAAADDRLFARPAKPLRAPLRHRRRHAARGSGPRPCCDIAARCHVDFRRRIVVHRRGGRLSQPLGKLFEYRRVEIAEQDFQLCFGHAAGDFVGMQKALAVGGRFGRQGVARQPSDEIGGNPDGVRHASLADRRVDVHAVDGDNRQVGRKRLDVDLAAAVAVERVANRRADLLQIELIDAVADLLVAGEADSHRAMRNLGMLDRAKRPFP